MIPDFGHAGQLLRLGDNFKTDAPCLLIASRTTGWQSDIHRSSPASASAANHPRRRDAEMTSLVPPRNVKDQKQGLRAETRAFF